MKITEKNIRFIAICFFLAAGLAVCTAYAGEGKEDANAQTQALQQKMMNDKEIMDKIRSLENDPEFQKILEDPEVMRAVNSGDVAALMANPQFLKLMNNRTVQEITNKVAK